MADKSFLDWPFLDDRHRVLRRDLDIWAARNVPGLIDHHDADGSCRRLVTALGQAGFLRHAVPSAFGGAAVTLEDRKSVV